MSLSLTSKVFGRHLFKNKYFWISQLLLDFDIKYLDIDSEGKANPKNYYVFVYTWREIESLGDHMLLLEAIVINDINLVKYMASDSSSDLIHAFELACNYNHLEIVKYLSIYSNMRI